MDHTNSTSPLPPPHGGGVVGAAVGGCVEWGGSAGGLSPLCGVVGEEGQEEEG